MYMYICIYQHRYVYVHKMYVHTVTRRGLVRFAMNSKENRLRLIAVTVFQMKISIINTFLICMLGRK